MAPRHRLQSVAGPVVRPRRDVYLWPAFSMAVQRTLPMDGYVDGRHLRDSHYFAALVHVCPWVPDTRTSSTGTASVEALRASSASLRILGALGGTRGLRRPSLRSIPEGLVCAAAEGTLAGAAGIRRRASVRCSVPLFRRYWYLCYRGIAALAGWSGLGNPSRGARSALLRFRVAGICRSVTGARNHYQCHHGKLPRFSVLEKFAGHPLRISLDRTGTDVQSRRDTVTGLFAGGLCRASSMRRHRAPSQAQHHSSKRVPA